MLTDDGDVIPIGRVDAPVDIGHLLDLTNRSVKSLPRDTLHTGVDEANTAVGGLGPELSPIVDGSTVLAVQRARSSTGLPLLIRSGTTRAEFASADIQSIVTWANQAAAITAQFMALDAAFTSKSEGEIIKAAVESEHPDSARVLVAVSVKTQTGAGEQEPREWRVRIDVQKVDDGAKMSNVEFVA